MTTQTKQGQTKGKWKITKPLEHLTGLSSEVEFEIVAIDGSGRVALIERPNPGYTRIGDAALIAAAPDLLEACKWFLEAQDSPAPRDLLTAAAMKASQAISKAEGKE